MWRSKLSKPLFSAMSCITVSLAEVRKTIRSSSHFPSESDSWKRIAKVFASDYSLICWVLKSILCFMSPVLLNQIQNDDISFSLISTSMLACLFEESTTMFLWTGLHSSWVCQWSELQPMQWLICSQHQAHVWWDWLSMLQLITAVFRFAIFCEKTYSYFVCCIQIMIIVFNFNQCSFVDVCFLGTSKYSNYGSFIICDEQHWTP